MLEIEFNIGDEVKIEPPIGKSFLGKIVGFTRCFNNSFLYDVESKADGRIIKFNPLYITKDEQNN